MMSKENFPGNNTGYSDWLFITSFLLRNDFKNIQRNTGALSNKRNGTEPAKRCQNG